MAALRRALPLWLALVAAYALTLAIDHRVRPDEAQRLLVIESVATDGDLDVADDARGGPVRPPAPSPEGRTLEPVGAGFAMLCAPAWALGGATAVRLWLAMLLAAGFCLAAALARRLVPEPWATRGALACGLSPPALGAACAIAPEAAGAAAIAGAALLALRVRDAPRAVWAFWCAALVGTLPWLGLELLAPAVVLSLALARWLRRRRRALTGFIALEVVLTSGVVYLTLHERLFGDLTPYGPSPTGASGVLEHLGRWDRLPGLLLARDVGLLRWAPVLALAAVALGLLVRSRRGRLARALEGQVDVEVAALLLALLAGAVWMTAAFLAPAERGPWFPARELVPALPVAAALVAWALRTAPRVGAVLLGLTVVAGAWLVLGGLLGDDGLRPPQGDTLVWWVDAPR